MTEITAEKAKELLHNSTKEGDEFSIVLLSRERKELCRNAPAVYKDYIKQRAVNKTLIEHGKKNHEEIYEWQRKAGDLEAVNKWHNKLLTDLNSNMESMQQANQAMWKKLEQQNKEYVDLDNECRRLKTANKTLVDALRYYTGLVSPSLSARAKEALAANRFRKSNGRNNAKKI